MTKKLKELKSLSKDELSAKARELEGQLFKLRLQAATKKLVKTALPRNTRRELARVRTLERLGK